MKWSRLACLIWLLSLGSAQAAYIGSPPLVVGMVNPAGETLGAAQVGVPTLPLQTTNIPNFTTSPAPSPFLNKTAILPDVLGRAAVEITDGVQVASVAPPFRGASIGQPSLVVSLSPKPSLQCPYTAAVNISANATIITNPGGANIHVCAALLINGTTAQSVTLLEGTGTACATNPIYWVGGSGATAALSANGGFAMPGNWINYPMQKTGDNVCVIISGSTNVSGSLTYGLY
jgi:hypothetical protein